MMTNETQALLSAIETLCGKKKAKLLRRLAKAAVKAERENERQLASNPLYGHIDGIGGVTYTDGTFPSTSTTHIYAGDSSHTGAVTYDAIGPTSWGGTTNGTLVDGVYVT